MHRTAMLRPLLILGATVLFVWAVKYHPFWVPPRVIDDDARQHVYWTYRFQDPELFRHDLLTAFMSSPKVAPLGYQALYFLGARVMDALLFSQLLALLLALLTTTLMFFLGQELGGPRGGMFAALLLLFYYLYSSSGGLPKSFAFPLLLGSVYLLGHGAFGGVACLLVLQSLLYPPMLLNVTALAALRWGRLWRLRHNRQAWRHLIVLGLGVGLAGSILLGVYTFSASPSFGSQITPAEAKTMPEFSPQGRSAFYGKTLLQSLLNDRWGIGGVRLLGFMLLLGVMVFLQKPPRLVVPAMATDLLLTASGLFVLAHLVLFRLHLPSRYVLYTFPLAALLLLAANSEAALTALRTRFPQARRSWHVWRTHWGRRWGTITLLALGFAYAQNRYFVYLDPLTVVVDAPALQLYRYLRTLPKDVLIAGHPLTLDNVPLFARRKVLVNQELSLPYFTGYYAQVRQRLFDTFTAYYAADFAVVRRFVDRYGIDYVLIDKRYFTPQFLRGRIYYEPFDSFIKQRLAGQRRFALLEAIAQYRVTAFGPYVLLAFPRSSPR